MTAYYNEHDPHAAQWLRNLMAAGHIAKGHVDDRDIQKVTADDLKGYDQCHFFAGIGVWSAAAKASGWRDDEPLWTVSCPCQPFSGAGKRLGVNDERHLWPEFFRLAKQCKPSIIAGEQVAGKDGLAWLDHVQADMENENYAFGAVDLCAAGVGAPHKRQRLYFSAFSRMGDSPDSGREHGNQQGPSVQPAPFTDAGRGSESSRCSSSIGSPGRGPVNGFWKGAEWVYCADGYWRAVEPGTLPLVNGASSRVGRLRAYGNALVKEVAQVFLESVREIRDANRVGQNI